MEYKKLDCFRVTLCELALFKSNYLKKQRNMMNVFQTGKKRNDDIKERGRIKNVKNHKMNENSDVYIEKVISTRNVHIV